MAALVKWVAFTGWKIFSREYRDQRSQCPVMGGNEKALVA